MRVEKECPCCGAIYTVSFVQAQRGRADGEYDIEEETFEDEAEELYPEFCPFCGAHEDDEPIEDDE